MSSPPVAPRTASHTAADGELPLRIAFLTYRGKPHVGGQGVYTRHLAKALVDLGHHVEVLGGQPYPILDERVPLIELPSLDIYNDHFPMRQPGLERDKAVGTTIRDANANNLGIYSTVTRSGTVRVGDSVARAV